MTAAQPRSVVLRCPSGIAGNMWLAVALALGADTDVLFALPAMLGVSPARLDWRSTVHGNVVCADLEVVDIDPRIDGTYEDVRSRISALPLSSDLRIRCLNVLKLRRDADSGSAFATEKWWGSELTDTLVDVVGGVLAWDLLGRPIVTTSGPVVLGSAAEGVRTVLGSIPWHPGNAKVTLTTATGAALLRTLWAPYDLDLPAMLRCEVRSAFARRYHLPPLTAELHEHPPARS